MDDIRERLARVRAELAAAAASAGRDPASVRLVAVSKTKSVELIREAYAASQRDFGENYVQEMTAKAEALSDLPDIRFHFIGHLQRNKARFVAVAASMVHTVDSARLAEELGKRTADAVSKGLRRTTSFETDRGKLPVLVEVNVGGEAQKSGCAPGELLAVLDAIENEPSLSLAGLMTVPPFTERAEDSRAYFDALARLRDAHGGAKRLPELSMGMTRDFAHAVQAGATLVRIGTAIFGERGAA